jgi:hypothetical protein
MKGEKYALVRRLESGSSVTKNVGAHMTRLYGIKYMKVFSGMTVRSPVMLHSANL